MSAASVIRPIALAIEPAHELPMTGGTLPTRYLERPHGRIAYDDTGDLTGQAGDGGGSLVVALPSLGDVRQEYRLLVPHLRAAGHRVVTADLRGHGESSVGWPSYSTEDVGGDALALIEHLGAGPAVIVGTSLSGGAAVWAAAERLDLVKGIVLIGAFVRDIPASPVQPLLLRMLFARPWGPAAWGAYYQSLYPTSRPAGFADYRRGLVANLRQAGRLEATTAFMRASKAPIERRLGDVRAPALVLYGTRDPDFKDPAAEARLIAGRLGSAAPAVALIEGAGHYPHAEMPDATAAHIGAFLNGSGAPGDAGTRAGASGESTHGH